MRTAILALFVSVFFCPAVLGRQQAEDVSEPNCEERSGAECNALAYHYRWVLNDAINAANLYGAACYERSHTDSCTSLGVMYFSGDELTQDYTRAALAFREACTLGDAHSCGSVGLMAYDGLGVTQNQSLSASYYNLACEGGIYLMCHQAALQYHNGTGVTQDYDRAASLYAAACDGEVYEACVNLGTLVDLGQGRLQNYSEAVSYYRRGCAGGVMSGCFNLGMMYQEGDGVLQNFPAAHALFNIVAAEGNERARRNRSDIAERMTSDQISEAQQLARRCIEIGIEECGL